MLVRLPIDLAEVNAGNNSESLLNEIRHKSFILWTSPKKSLKKHKIT